MIDDNSNRLKELETALLSIELKRAELINEISSIRNSIASISKDNNENTILGRSVSQLPPITPADKIELFLKLFRCRENVYPKRWENTKTGKQGYSPSCDLEWVKPICQKPIIKCSECPHQKFPKLDHILRFYSSQKIS